MSRISVPSFSYFLKRQYTVNISSTVFFRACHNRLQKDIRQHNKVIVHCVPQQ